MKKNLYLLFVLCVALFASCGGGDTEKKRELVEKQAVSLRIPEVIDQLLVITEGDAEPIVRALGCSASTLTRLQKGESYPTQNAELELRELLLDAQLGDGLRTIERRDVNQGWFDRFCSAVNNFFFSWIGVLILVVALLGAAWGAGVLAFWIIVGEVGLLILANLLAWLLGWIFSKPELVDNFVTTIDVAWETLH